MPRHRNQAAVSECNTNKQVLYMALELSEKTWKVALSDGRPQFRMVNMPSRKVDRLFEEIARARGKFKLTADCPVVSCYEAGRDGFWLHRYLESKGVENIVVDPASIEVNRRKRRAKTDRIDAQKLLIRLIRHHRGEPKVWSVVRVPGVEDEDARQLHRELQELKKEAQEHRMRMSSLLVVQGVSMAVDKDFLERLEQVRLWDGSSLPPQLKKRLCREYERLYGVQQQIRKIEAQRRKLLKESKTPRVEKVRELQRLKGIGVNGSWIVVMELFGWRRFNNRKEVGGCSGLTGTPFDSGGSEHEQGISKAGNPLVRWIMVELAWCWLRFQPQSKMSRWYWKRFGHGSKRQRKVGIVALARKLLVALWRFVEFGVIPDGAVIA